MNIRNIRVVIGILLVVVIIWFSYEIHFKYAIDRYQGSLIEKQLEKDFVVNTKFFQIINEIKSGIGNISHLQFSKTGDYLEFEIKSDSFTDMNYDQLPVSAGETSNQDLKFIKISDDKNIIAKYANEEIVVEKPWSIEYKGKKTNPDLEQILSLKNLNIKKLEIIEDVLNGTNTIQFEKNDSLIIIRYAGHWGESYNYVTPLKNLNERRNWKKLSEQWYSSHYIDGLFCGYTNW